MDLLLFCTAFILQFVGHRVGDYLFQTDWQAQNKAKDFNARSRHVYVYSLTISLFILTSFGWMTSLAVFLITAIEHIFIDSRKPVVFYKKTIEKIVGNKGFKVEDMPFFVLIEIDQSIHYVRCFVIAALIGYSII